MQIQSKKNEWKKHINQFDKLKLNSGMQLVTVRVLLTLTKYEKDEMMKTLTALTLATVITLSFAAPAQANNITESLTETMTNQLTELAGNIKQQAKAALEKTATELLFATGTEQAEQYVVKIAEQTPTSQK